MSRSISHSEIEMALTCEARHAFGYTGRLTDGEVLHKRELAPRLSNGRAWGAAVAAWHAVPDDDSLMGVYQPIMAQMTAHAALRASYMADIEEQRESGVIVPLLGAVERENWLGSILDHYMATADRFTNLTRLEGEFDVPIPSRTGKRSSSRYRFQGFIDGFTIDRHGYEWIVEFKLRDDLTSPAQVQLSRQIRRYAWARQQQTGQRVVGVIVDERKAKPPAPPRIVQAKHKGEGIDGMVPSHAVDQWCLVEDYISACCEYGVEPHEVTKDALARRVWQFRHPIPFRESELKEAGEELVSAAKLIRDLDSGERYPIRNTVPYICRGCKFLEACPNPDDRIYLDTLFERRPPKRDRVREAAPGAGDSSTNGRDQPAASSDDNHHGSSSVPPPVVPAGASPRVADEPSAPQFSYANATSEEVPWT
jgi:PD-(D/E)XK nuclease superfamily protein